jgi:pyruvate formate lyase activating enzyme
MAAMARKGILNRRISRREFITKGAIGLAALGLGGVALNHWLKNSASVVPLSDAKEVYYYKRLGKTVQCQSCPHNCTLAPGVRGICRVKVNTDGLLYTEAYGNPCAVHLDPIEKKPLLHFLPGTTSYSIATAGCNFRCTYCQNWEISQFTPSEVSRVRMTPDQVVANAISDGAKSISYTYSEPSIFFEYMIDTAKLAHDKGLKNVWVTNGYLNEKPLADFTPYLDAANVDLKAFDEKIHRELTGGELKPVLETLKRLKEGKVWFEITNLVVPTYTDDLNMIRAMSKWIYAHLGPDYPLHFSRFYPMYQLTNFPPTPIETLEAARKIALEEGIHYVYVGNVPETKHQSTYCPYDETICVERVGYSIKQMNIDSEGNCKGCKDRIPGVWHT